VRAHRIAKVSKDQSSPRRRARGRVRCISVRNYDDFNIDYGDPISAYYMLQQILVKDFVDARLCLSRNVTRGSPIGACVRSNFRVNL